MPIIPRMAGKKQFNEDETLDRAITVFWERGYAATSMQDLAQATGVLRGSLYHAYGDKQAVFLRVFERYRRNFLDAARAQLANRDPAVALHDFFAYTIRTMTEAVPPTVASPIARRANKISSNSSSMLRKAARTGSSMAVSSVAIFVVRQPRVDGPGDATVGGTASVIVLIV